MFEIVDHVLKGYSGSEPRLTVPAGVIRIEDSAFAGNGAIEQILLPESLKSVGKLAFSECAKLERVVFSRGEVSLDEGAFAGSYGMRYIVGWQRFQQIGFGLYEYIPGFVVRDGFLERASVVYGYLGPKAETVSVPEGTQSIYWGAFMQNREIEGIFIPGTVKVIGPAAFYGSSVKKAFLEEGVEEIGDSAFRFSALEFISIPASAKTISRNSFAMCRNLRHVGVAEPGQVFAPGAEIDIGSILYTEELEEKPAPAAAVRKDYGFSFDAEERCHLRIPALEGREPAVREEIYVRANGLMTDRYVYAVRLVTDRNGIFRKAVISKIPEELWGAGEDEKGGRLTEKEIKILKAHIMRNYF